MHLTNMVATSNLGCMLDLRKIASENCNVIYRPSRFPALTWRPKFSKDCTILLFKTGKIVCLGKPDGAKHRTRIRRTARLLQKQGHNITGIAPIKVITNSAVHKLDSPIDLSDVVTFMNGKYEPEILNAALVRRGGTVYSISKGNSYTYRSA